MLFRSIAISNLTKERDHALAMVKVLKKENIEFGAGHAKLLESHDQLQIQLTNYQSKSSLVNTTSDDACASNSISCEASILKENVELRAQLELLTSKYGKLE